MKPSVPADLPGPKAKKLIERDHEALAKTTKTAPVAISHGRGSWVYGIDGEVLLDFTSGVGVLNTGHAHPKIVQAVKDQAEKFLHFAGTDFYYESQVDLAERLAKITPGSFGKKVYFGNSGTEANEAALKAVKWATRRPQVLAFMGAFHGRTQGTLSLTSSKIVQRARYFPTVPGATHVPYPNPYRNPWGIDGYAEPGELTNRTLDFIEAYLFQHVAPPDEVGCFFTETIQGEGGYVVPPKGFLPALKKLCERHGIAYIADEVQSGNGRTGKWYACEHEGVAPDILTTAKGLASGLPIGATVIRDELSFGVDGAHSTTFGGNPVACAAGVATLKVIEEEKLLANATTQGKRLIDALASLKDSQAAIGDVRGRGLMVAIEFVKDAKGREPDVKRRDRVLEESLRRGLVLLPCGKSGIRFIPPLTVTGEEIDLAVGIVRDACRAVP
ncbi:MAG: acetyl ornithine aminotransferase family protein [Methanobacteriota archaeon]